jgi:hypothetical protein
MGANLGPEEVRAASIAAMGRELGELHHALGNELTYLHLKWKKYCALFGTSPERIDLLNEAAPDFFGKLQHILGDDVLLHLCTRSKRKVRDRVLLTSPLKTTAG